MLKNKTEYKAIFVKKETHKKFALRAVEEEKTFDILLGELLKVNLKK